MASAYGNPATGRATTEARAHNAITCAEPRCPHPGTDLVPVAVGPGGEVLEMEFCPEHAHARSLHHGR